MNESKQGEVGEVTVLNVDVRKADTKALIVTGTASFPEDSYSGLYWTGVGHVVDPAAILEPVFKPGVLHSLTRQNNILSQCIEAMEVNIDGTGHSIDLLEEDGSEDEAEKKMLEDFFLEPYPGKTMVEIRRAIRVDIESTGMGYMEVLRALTGEIVLINYLESDSMRLIRYDDPVPAKRVVKRNGKELNVQINIRERRFVSLVNGRKTYFKEFGATRDLDKETGLWGDKVAVEKKASEIILFTGVKEPKSSYYVPRWINNLPAILGSRKSEEYNLEFFDGGGIPPVIVFVEGGMLAIEAKTELKAHLAGKSGRHRGVIVEAVSTSGSIESSGNVRVRVEKFGDVNSKDAMYQIYDKNSEEHVRVAFRLPPLFIGRSADMNYATAYTSYMVAEAQVFVPEREEFDAKINATIVKELGAKKYVFRSLPMTLVDVERQLKALELVSGKSAIDNEELVNKLNEIMGLEMEASKEPPPPATGPGQPPGQPQEALTSPPNLKAVPKPVEETKPSRTSGGPSGIGSPAKPGTIPMAGKAMTLKQDDARLLKLAVDWSDLMGLSTIPQDFPTEEKERILKEVSTLDTEAYRAFDFYVATYCLEDVGGVRKDMGELCGCASHLMEA